MRAEVTFLSRMILRVDEDRVVGTSGHTGFTADADRFIEIDDAVRAFEHGRRGTRDYAWCMRALIAAGYLVRSPRLRKDTDIYVLDIGSGHADGNHVFRFACGRARVTADATRVVDYFGPLDGSV